MIEELIEPEDFCFMFVNMESERFDTCFSKYEMVSALEIISRVMEEKKIPGFSVKTSVKIHSTQATSSISKQNPSDIPVTSKYDDEFRGQFRELTENIPDPCVADFYDVFSSPGVKKKISDSGLSKVLLCGFDSEREILASTIGAVREHLTPVIVSDCISSRSERVFFEVMDVLSRWAVVGDSRDMVKLWNLW